MVAGEPRAGRVAFGSWHTTRARSATPERLADASIEPSVGSIGDSYDNALAETINGLYKAEVIYRRSWKNLQEAELATLEWVDWFNHKNADALIANLARCSLGFAESSTSAW